MLASSRCVSGSVGPNNAEHCFSFVLAATAVRPTVVTDAGGKAAGNNGARPTAATSKAMKAGSAIENASDNIDCDTNQPPSRQITFL